MVNHPNRRKTAIGLSASRVAKKPVKPRVRPEHDQDWAAFIHGVRTTFVRRVGSPGRPLFMTDATGFNNIYLRHLGAERGVHDCSACRHFLDRFGGLVLLSEDGYVDSALWDADMVPPFYRDAVTLLAARAMNSKVTGPFLSKGSVWGDPMTAGAWTHLSVVHPFAYKHPLLSAGQAMAAKREDFKTVAAGLEDFTPEVIAEALRLFTADHLASSEKFTGPLHWLANLHAQRRNAPKFLRDNILWREIATAPAGFCHPRSAVTGTLLEDLANGVSFPEAKRRFNAKVGPLAYQRPKAAPAAGNIVQAEKIFEKLGLAPALERRFARLDECQTAWAKFASKRQPTSREGIFSHIAPKGGARPVGAAGVPAAVMTWEKFARTVLPSAEAVEVYVAGNMPFIALTTAVHEDAPPILKWDRDDERNPVAWYVYPGGSTATQWGLPRAGWHEVLAIVPLPPMWGSSPKPNLGEGFVFAIAGCSDTRVASSALFPECLRSELHEVRATIEAHSRSSRMARTEGRLASGLDVRKGMLNMNYALQVTANGVKTDYKIDRWD